MPPRYQARPTDLLTRVRNEMDALGRPGMAGTSRLGGNRGRGGGQQSVVADGTQENDDGTNGAGELIRLSASADVIASGGDYLTYQTIERRIGFEVGGTSTSSFTLPRTGLYGVELWFAWDSYTDGGTVEVEINGEVRRTHPDDGSGSRFEWTALIDAEEGDGLRVKVTHADGSAQTAAWDLTIASIEPIGDAPVGTVGSAGVSVVTYANGASDGDDVTVAIPTAVNAGDLLVAFGVNVTNTAGTPVASPAGPTLRVKGIEATYFVRAADHACGYWVLDGDETEVLCPANTVENYNDTLRLAFVVLRGQSGAPSLVDQDSGASSPLSATGAGDVVVAFGRGVSPGSTAAGNDAVTLTGAGTVTANQAGSDPIAAGYGEAGAYGLSWVDADITASALFLVDVN